MGKKNPFISDSLQASIDKLKHLQDESPLLKSIAKLKEKQNPEDWLPEAPSMDDLLKQPELNPLLIQPPKPIPLIEKLDQISEFDQKLVAANKELIAQLELANKKNAETVASHKHDWIKNLAITVIGCIISFALAVWATKNGWL